MYGCGMVIEVSIYLWRFDGLGSPGNRARGCWQGRVGGINLLSLESGDT